MDGGAEMRAVRGFAKFLASTIVRKKEDPNQISDAMKPKID